MLFWTDGLRRLQRMICVVWTFLFTRRGSIADIKKGISSDLDLIENIMVMDRF